MSTVTSQPTEVSPHTCFVHLFDVKMEQFRLPDRSAESLKRPYEASDLLREAIAAGVWPRE
ncbi:MAG TPA: hypothetical protein VJR71_11295 [Pseudolabrys sp.]|nr:hypothetical protein [Pseudolabrys sp.]